MTKLQQAVALFLAGGILLGAGAGSLIGYRIGVQEGLAADISAREILASEVSSLQNINQRQSVSLQTAEASIKALTGNLDDQQRSHEYENRELELYRRIESGGLERGIHVDDVQLTDIGDGPILRVTLVQVGSRTDTQGTLGIALIGANLPGASDDRVILADAEGDSALEFDFRLMSRISVALPGNLATMMTNLSEKPGEYDGFLDLLDMVEIDVIPRDSRRRPKRVTIPTGRMSIGLAE